MNTYKKGGTQKKDYSLEDVINVNCPLCEGIEFKELYKERSVLGVVRCSNCGLIYINPRLREPEKIYWGSEDNYIREARLIFEGKASHHRDKNYLADLRIIRKFKPKGNFLDIGTNMGFFLRCARNKGWDLYGIEPSPALSNIARKQFGLNVKNCFLKDAEFPNDYFDVVTMTDVFEHLTAPGDLLKEVHRILKPDGILYVKVPNALFNLLKLNLAKAINKLNSFDIFDSYEHVVHYTDKTLELMLERNKFEVGRFYIGKPIQVPNWHQYLGEYFQYPVPWCMDFKKKSLRSLFFYLSLLEFFLRRKSVGYFSSNIIAVARKKI